MQEPLCVRRNWSYLRTVCDYVHLNPVRAKLLTPKQPLQEYAWSSWPEYLKPPEQRPGWLRVERYLGELGIPKDSVAGRIELENYLEVRRAQEDDGELKRIRRGWCLGSKAFREELLAQTKTRSDDERVAKLKIKSEAQNEFCFYCRQD